LERAEREFGVPDWLIVGIIGVETLYGRHMGTHRVLDSLATLGFDFPPEHPRAAQRTEFFRSELAAFLRLSREHPRPPDAWRGSFAGAIGLPQFMPSNWPRFGVDFDADGRVDLIDSVPDAIGSVANFLVGHGWQPGMPTHFPLSFDPARLDLPTLLAPSIRPSFTLEQLQALGVQPVAPRRSTTACWRWSSSSKATRRAAANLPATGWARKTFLPSRATTPAATTSWR